MPNAAGDLVTVLSLEDFEFRTGLRNDAALAKQFGASVNAAGASAGKGSGAFGRGVSQMGFAMQDFSSVMSMGGKNALGRALMGTMNNVQMLGAAMGPWGLAITSVGGALGSVLIPKLFEAEVASEDFGKAIEKSANSLDHLLSKESASFAFAHKLGHLGKEGSVEQVKSAIEENSAEIEGTQHELARRRLELRNNILGAGALGGLKYDPNKPLFDAENKLLQPNMGINADILGDAAAERIEKQGEKVRDLEDTLARRQRRATALEDVLPDAKKNDFVKEMGRIQDKDLHELESIRHKRMSPLEKMQAGLSDLGALGARQPGNAGIIAGGMDTLFEEFAKALPKAQERLAPAMLKGSAEALSAINKASVGDDSRKQQLEQAKKAVDLAKDQLTALKAIEGKVEPVVPVALGGG